MKHLLLIVLLLMLNACALQPERLIVPMPDDTALHQVLLENDEFWGSSTVTPITQLCQLVKMPEGVIVDKLSYRELTSCNFLTPEVLSEKGIGDSLVGSVLPAAMLSTGIAYGLANSGDTTSTSNSSQSNSTATSNPPMMNCQWGHCD